MTPRTTSPIPLLALFALCAPGLAQGTVDLKVTAKKGASVWLLQQTTLTQSIDAQGMMLGSEQSLNRVLQFTVKDVDDKGQRLVEARIARVYGSFDLPMGMGTADFDSAAATAAAGDDEGDGGGMDMSGGMKALLLAGAGKAFTVKVDARGQVVELLDDAKALLKSTPTPALTGRMLGAPTWDEDALKELVVEAFGERPAAPIAVGGSWQRQAPANQAIAPATTRLDLKLAKADAATCEIAITGAIDKLAAATPAVPVDDDADDDSDPQAAAERNIRDTLLMKNGKLTGACRIARDDGFVAAADSTASIDVEMSAGPWGEVSMSLKSTKKLTRTTADAATPKKAEATKSAGKPATPTTGGGKK
ncbi:MAG: hypothetical protein ACK6DT_00795 [Planctomycetota bacterium]